MHTVKSKVYRTSVGASSFVLYGRAEDGRLSNGLANLEFKKKDYGGGDDAQRDMIEKSSCSWEEGNSSTADDERKYMLNKSSSSSTASSDCKFVPYSKLSKRRWHKKERKHHTRLEQRQDRDLTRLIPSSKSSSRSVYEGCFHMSQETCRLGTLIVNSSHLLFSYEDGTLNSSIVDEANLVDYLYLFPLHADDVTSTSLWLPKKHCSIRRWGKHALERHNQRDYDGNFSDGDSSTSTESSTDSSVSCQNSNLHVDSSLIRTVEERARRRLQELDYAEKELADSTNLNSDSRSSSTYTSQSRWEKDHLRKIERRARRYIRKLDDCSSDSSDTAEPHDDTIYASISNEELDDEETQFYNQQHKIKGFKIPLSYIVEIYPRTYQMSDIAIEIFLLPLPPSNHSPRLPLNPLPNSSFIIVIPDNIMPSRHASSRRNQFASLLRLSAPNLSMHYWHTSLNAGDIKKYFHKDPLRRLTKAWRNGLISNFDYLIRINAIAGRTRVDLSH